MTRKYKIPLIIDEVQTGIGRTGKWWAYEHYDIKPDIVSIGKALQVGAVLFDKYFEPDLKGVLSSTWGGGSRIDLAIGAKTIEVIKKERVMENVDKMALILKKGLEELCQISDSILDVRGLGLMIGIEFDNLKKRDHIINKLFKVGLLVLPAGFKTIRILPPLIISEDEINQGLELMSQCLRSN
jgi:4-aminobutyrate aminotransferase